ncbi:hypothetical protein HMPREF1318_1830 [Actinomyces massiliensis F0489]|uniref:Uncharacterized protein n=1 Tax=Actinomyces massiliensis F0489 TaxID=1125718 RepID=J1HNT0_9ACTO|nr:hypothetical protein HMPREF1318_1830 [Actinomyces massiliensis F0489]
MATVTTRTRTSGVSGAPSTVRTSCPAGPDVLPAPVDPVALASPAAPAGPTGPAGSTGSPGARAARRNPGDSDDGGAPAASREPGASRTADETVRSGTATPSVARGERRHPRS